MSLSGQLAAGRVTAGRGAERRSDDDSSPSDRIFFAASLLALVAIAFIAGAVLAIAGVFPGPQIAQAYQGGKALYDRVTGYSDVYSSDLWFPERRPDKGVTVNIPAKTQDGATLYTSGHDAAAFLIAIDGTVLHEWRRPFSSVWDENAEVKNPQPDSHVYFRKAKVLDNGDLLAIYEGVGDTPYGYGMVKLDRNSEVLWTYLAHTHHDFDVGPDGRIYVLTHEISADPVRSFDNLKPPRLDDFLVILSPKGKELAKIPLLKAVARSPYRHLLHTVSSYSTGDPLHTNDVDLITSEAAKNFAEGKAGDVLLSFRELNAIAVLDIARQKIVWAARGSWVGQHDPDILLDGRVVLFDNYGHFKFPSGTSRVLEFDPQTMEIVWQYAGDADHPLDSLIRSSQQRLANGNTLIVESNGGRILEVTPQGEIVWEFVNPVRGGERNARIAIVAWAERIDADTMSLAHLSPN